MDILKPGEHFHRCACGCVFKHDTYRNTRWTIVRLLREACQRANIPEDQERLIRVLDSEGPDFERFVLSGLAEGIEGMDEVGEALFKEQDDYDKAHDCPKCGENVRGLYYPQGTEVSDDMKQRGRQHFLLDLLEQLEGIAMLEKAFKGKAIFILGKPE